jgi:NAD(P)-dependent dehydrogenase (short-subunit alcohol dehydrogenase family)
VGLSSLRLKGIREMKMLLDGKVAVIAGAATGIGRATALLFAAQGAAIVVADVSADAAAETVRTITETGGAAVFVPTDVGQVSDIEKLVKTAVSTCGRLDIYFHNAGIAGPGLLDITTEEAYDRCMAINLKAALFGAKFAVPPMRETGGVNLLFTASTSGVHPSPNGSPTYSISKAGLVMLTRCLALQLSQDHIRVNCLCPGPVTCTPLWDDFVSRNPGVDPVEQTDSILRKTVPLQRSGTPEEMAAAALFLVSPESAYITGVALPVDGGTLAM